MSFPTRHWRCLLSYKVYSETRDPRVKIGGPDRGGRKSSRRRGEGWRCVFLSRSFESVVVYSRDRRDGVAPTVDSGRPSLHWESSPGTYRSPDVNPSTVTEVLH